jgi:hypothetical protein
VIGVASPRRVHVELTRDRRFDRRVARLTVVSAVALGLVWSLVVTTLEAPPEVEAAFAAGWLLMPTTLASSLLYPRLRYGLVLPASLVSIGLLAVCLGWLPADPAVAFGWILMTAGVALGGGLGLWLWYRLLPVPGALDDPFSAGRWALIATHVALIVGGFALAARALVA